MEGFRICALYNRTCTSFSVGGNTILLQNGNEISKIRSINPGWLVFDVDVQLDKREDNTSCCKKNFKRLNPKNIYVYLLMESRNCRKKICLMIKYV